MADLTLTTEPKSPFNGCLLCGSHGPEFVDAHFEQPSVSTPYGLQTLPVRVYLCVGTEENPGCAVQIGRLAGLDRVAGSEIERLRRLTSELARERDEALAQRVVPVPELLEAIRAGA